MCVSVCTCVCIFFFLACVDKTLTIVSRSHEVGMSKIKALKDDTILCRDSLRLDNLQTARLGTKF